MSRPRRYYKAGKCYLISSRIIKGLPLPPAEYVNSIIWGILARAQWLYPATISHFLFMPNHFHMFVVCLDPQDLVNFIKYVKAELARSINRILGSPGQTVWAGRYDAEIILTLQDVIEKIAYTYVNPQKAGLVDTIEEYPGVSSWQMFIENIDSHQAQWIPSSVLSQAPRHRRQRETMNSLVANLGQDRAELTISPYAWMKGLGCDLSREQIKEQILLRIKTLEQEFRSNRKGAVIGADNLRNQSIYRSYYPKKFSRRAICICHDRETRKSFMENYYLFVESCRAVYRRWKVGDFSSPLPAEALSPPLPQLIVAIA